MESSLLLTYDTTFRLLVRREATTEEIKKAYRTLSRKYHPDGMRFRTILPGSCNNMDDVRDQWERIKLSYEILSRPKMRKRYDRKVFMADPAAAIQRAAVDAAVKGAVSVGKGIGQGLFQAGAFAFQQLTKKTEAQDSKSRMATTTTDSKLTAAAQGGTIAMDDSSAAHSITGSTSDGVFDNVVLLTGDGLATSSGSDPKKSKSSARRRRAGTGKGFARPETSKQ
jgi:DnaJ-class molecular chaperone